MLKYPLYALIILLSFFYAHSQKSVDSLKNVIANSNQDTTKVNAYIHFFFTDLFYDNPTEVINYSHKARTLSKKIGYPIGEVKAHNNLGYIYRTRSENDSARYHYKMAIEKGKLINFYKGLTDAHIGIGNIHNQLANWSDAIKQFKTVIYLARKKGDSIQIGSAHNNIGNTYLNQSKFENALVNYQKAADLGDASIRGVALINIAVVHNQMGNLELARTNFENSIKDAERLGKRGHLAFIYRNLGILEKKSGNYDKAIEQYTRALEYYKNLSDDFSSSEIIQNMGNVYFEQKDYVNALNHYEQSLAIQQKINYPVGQCYNLLYIATVQKETGEIDKAKNNLKKVEICADTLNLLSAKSDATQHMSIILQQQGQYQKALEYQIEFKKLSDSIKTLNSEEKIAELDTKYQTTKKENEIKLLSTENEVANLKIDKQNNLRNFLIIAALILAALAFALYSRYTTKTRANKKLKELDTLKNKFYTNISHEFRTPLTLILNPLDKVLQSKAAQKTKDNVVIAHRNAGRLLELTNQMLDLSKLEAGKLQLYVANDNIKDFLNLVVSSFQSLATSKKIDFNTSFELQNDFAFFDSDKLQKILNNLLSNAFKFTPNSGEVNFNASIKNGLLSLEVKDTGKGIKENEKVQIFNRFHQGLQGETSGGTGIGLTLTRELVLLHKGTITVNSQEDRGSTFKIEIPITKNEYKTSELIPHKINQTVKTVEQSLAFETTAAQFKNELPIVLVVEDNLELRNYLNNLLNNDYQVYVAKNGKQGVDKAQTIIPDIIISDWMMPEMDGGQLCEAIKKDERTSHIPVILLTAKADKDSKLDGLTIGADDYLSKPFDNEELLVRTKNLITQRELLRNKYADTLLVEPTKVSIADPDKLFMEKAITTVNNHINDAAYTVEQFQKDVGMSRTQLHRKLKALVNQSASEFIRNLRLQRAADMLSQNHLQVSEVAYQCGFNNLSYFGQCFKEKYDVTPSQYKNS